MKKCVALFILSCVSLGFCYCGQKVSPPNTAPAETVQPVEQERQVEQVQQAEPEKTPETEALPLVEPKQNDKPGESKPVEEPQALDIMKSINSGITDVFKDFGYSGDVQVPDEFIKRIVFYIRYFSEDEKGSRFYKRAMNRGAQYFPMIKDVFTQRQLPPALIYLPVVESGFNTRVRSRASAVGMWQFMKGTAKMYGLKVTRSVDERKDPEKATAAAASYLNDLLSMFGMEDPFLGICAYNAGEGKILNALRNISYTERSFWTLVKKKLLHYETDEYIPRLVAVILMNHDEEKFKSIAKVIPAVPATEEEKEDEEIINAMHSPREDLEEVEDAPVPVEAPPIPAENSAGAPQFYTVKKGETVYRIAKRFGVSESNLRDWNNLKNNDLFTGQKLKLYGSASSEPAAEMPAAKKKSPGGFKLTYTVNYSDTLVRIALFFKGVSARDIMRWNGLRSSRIHPGKKLTVYLKEPLQKIISHVIKKGETAKDIARMYKVRMELVLSLNGLRTDSRLKPGQRLKIFIF